MAHMRHCAPFGESGFTLIELMIVMVIIGSVMALAAPRIGKSLEKTRLQSASRKLSAVLRYTRQMAISRKKEYAVTFDDHSYTYVRVTRKSNKDDEGEDSEEDQTSLAGKKGLGEKGILEKKILVDLRKELKSEEISLSYQSDGEDEASDNDSDKEIEIIFYPKGESSGGKVILAMNEINMAFQIEVDPITGRVSVKRKTENE